MSEREGPRVVEIDGRGIFMTCVGCRYLHDHLVESGKEPKWESYCSHEKADSCTGGFIGYTPEEASTPEWCPLTKNPKL